MQEAGRSSAEYAAVEYRTLRAFFLDSAHTLNVKCFRVTHLDDNRLVAPEDERKQ